MLAKGSEGQQTMTDNSSSAKTRKTKTNDKFLHLISEIVDLLVIYPSRYSVS